MFHSPPPDRQDAYQRTDDRDGDGHNEPDGATAVPAADGKNVAPPAANNASAANTTVTKGPAAGPAETTQDGIFTRLMMPNCNNEERAWIKSYQEDQRRLTMESIALDRSKGLDHASAATLLKEIYRVKEVAAKTWAYYQNKMRARNRNPAHLQMKPKWQEIDLLMEQAIYRLSTRYPELVDAGADDDDEVLHSFVPHPGAQTGARAKQNPAVVITAPPSEPDIPPLPKKKPKKAAAPPPPPPSSPQTRSKTAAAAVAAVPAGDAPSSAGGALVTTTRPPDGGPTGGATAVVVAPISVGSAPTTSTAAVVASTSVGSAPTTSAAAPPPSQPSNPTLAAPSGPALGAAPTAGSVPALNPPLLISTAASTAPSGTPYISGNFIPQPVYSAAGAIYSTPGPFPSVLPIASMNTDVRQMGGVPQVVGAPPFPPVFGSHAPSLRFPLPQAFPTPQLRLPQQQQQQHQDQHGLADELRRMRADLEAQKREMTTAKADVAKQVQSIQQAAQREKQQLQQQHEQQIQELRRQLDYAHEVYRQLEAQQAAHGESSSFRPEEQRQSTPDNRRPCQDVRFDHLTTDGVYRGSRRGGGGGRGGGGPTTFQQTRAPQEWAQDTGQGDPAPAPATTKRDQQQPAATANQGRSTQSTRAVPASRAAQDPRGISTGGAAARSVHPHPVINRFARLIPDYGKKETLSNYAIPQEDETPEWYQDNLPAPWDRPPADGEPLITEPKKLEQLVTVFSGRKVDYAVWMTSFVSNIHRAKASVGIKAKCLIKALNKQDEMLRELLATLSADRDSYARAIHKLTDWYSHPRGTLAAKLQRLNEIQNVRATDLMKLQKLHIRMEDYCDTAASMGRADDLVTIRTYEENLNRLDKALRRDFLRWVRLQQARRDVPSMLAWLGELVKDARESEEALDWEKKEKTPEHTSLITLKKTPTECPLCKENHELALCPGFLDLTPTQRRRRLEEWRRCYCCLEAGHQIRECTSGSVCPTCQRKHHHLLHGSLRRRRQAIRKERALMAGLGGDGDEEDEEEAADDEWSEDSAVEEIALKAVGTRCSVALQTIPVLVQNPETKKSVKMNLLMDQGATGAFLSKKAAEELCLTGRMVETSVAGFGGAVTTERTLAAAVQVSAIHSPHKKNWIYVHVMDEPAGNYTPTNWETKKKEYEHLRDLPVPPPVQGRKVDIMIGMATPELLCSLAADRTGKNERDPIARLTRLGWVIAGPTGESKIQPTALFTSVSSPLWETMPLGEDKKFEKDDLHRRVEKMWEIDTQIDKETYSPVEEKIMQWMKHKLQLKEGKYELPTLWKNDSRPGNNFSFVRKRLEALKASKHFKDKDLRTEFMANLDEWIKDDHVEEVETQNPDKDPAYYLATFPIVRRDKTTTQVRPVMDGKAKAGKSKALNEYLHKGPKLINELTEVFLRFRLRRVAVAADVKKMFYQIRLAEEDRDWHRFLWPDDGPTGFRIFRWKVHPFGSAASPCIAIYTIKEHARRHREEFPRAAEMVIHSTLVDDNLDSVDTEEEAVQLIKDAQQLYARAGMKLRKIISSSPSVLQSFAEEERSPTIDLASFCNKEEHVPLVKTLGVIYLCEEDQFSFHMETPLVKKWTKREILSFEARLYDPHGFVSPFIIISRMILQRLWKLKLGWDDGLPEEVELQWREWLQGLALLPRLRIDRCLTQSNVQNAELHVFCDASGKGYAAVAYLVTGSKDMNNRCCRLVISKAKVAPLKQLSIPRLELMAALLGAELAEKLYPLLNISKENVHYYTDSTNVLCWIRSDSQDYNSFTGTRVARIQTATEKNSWRWTDTDHNPADLPSRGCNLDKLLDNDLWWKGPAFLATGEVPPQPSALSPTDDVLRELKKKAQFSFLVSEVPTDGYDGSEWFPVGPTDWQKLLRITARILKWRRRTKGPILMKELREAETLVVRAVQASAFGRSLHDLKRHDELSNKSHLLKLPPFLDKQGCLRLAGRLRDASWMEYEERHPILLPKIHPATEALIRYYHEKVLNHAGAQHTLSIIVRRFWIVGGTTAVRKVVQSCVECRRRKATPSQQVQASLPDYRLLQSNFFPFQKTALDMAGPFRVKYQDVRGERKRYILLLTCMVCRAIHLEELQDPSAASFLAAFDRFTARRGVPALVLSDNGSNFVAGLSELRLLWTEEARTEVRERLPHIEWDFTPPKGPHFGGVYERLVRAVKQTLYHTCPAAEVIPWEDFHTGLVVAEGILNSRPLTYRTSDTADPTPICPADLMAVPLYRPLAGAPWGWNLRKKWHQLQKRLDHLWSRLRQELQPYLQELTAWRSKRRSLKVGDVVVLMDEKRRGRWPLGKIVRTEVSHDGQVRRIQVLSSGTVYRRPISQVALLISPDDEESLIQAGEAVPTTST